MTLDYYQLLWVVVGVVITWLYKEMTKNQNPVAPVTPVVPVTPNPLLPNLPNLPGPIAPLANQILLDLIKQLMDRLHQSIPAPTPVTPSPVPVTLNTSVTTRT